MKEKIKELFSMLPRTEQLELLRELNSNTETNNPVIEVAAMSQKIFGENIRFTITNMSDSNNSDIKAELSSPWGTFTANGINQRIAKVRVAEIALESLKTNQKKLNSDCILTLKEVSILFLGIAMV
jgi:hypothetical protein